MTRGRVIHLRISPLGSAVYKLGLNVSQQSVPCPVSKPTAPGSLGLFGRLSEALKDFGGARPPIPASGTG